MFFAFTLSYLSCLSLCMSMQRHFQQVWPQKKLSPQQAKTLSALGWLFLISATVLLAKIEGIAVGLVFSCGVFSAAAFILIMLLNFAARVVLASAVVLTLLSIFSTV